jgi:hypothetical protein
VSERFYRWKENLHVLVVDVTPVTPSVTIPWNESFSGCKSWVNFEHPTS